MRAVWQSSDAPSWVRPRPDHHLRLLAVLELVPVSPEAGVLGSGAERPGRRRPYVVTAACLGSVVGVVLLGGPGPRGGRAPRVEDRRGGVPGPKGPGRASAPALALTCGGGR
ncbi:hypothetical protein GCM10023201_53840 [Actinomycetospora corticicola]